MWAFQHQIKVKSTKEKVWEIWSDVENWNSWDSDLLWSKMDDVFKVGSIGYLKPKSGPKTKFKITECSKNKSFTARNFLPLTKMEFIHKIKTVEGGIELTHKIVISGFLSFLFARVVGKNLAKGLPKAMGELKKLAEK